MSILTTFQQTIIDNRLISAGDTVLIGVSGGADSVCLLHLFLQIQSKFGLKLIAAHVNHKLRKSADTDQRFVETLCRERGIPCECMTVSIPKQPKDSLEQAARKKRFTAFARLMKKHRADVLALAHHRDDLAETVLMRLIRGTGLQGLTAMTPKRTIEGMTVIRPLLTVSRSEIESFLKRSKLICRTDPTNADTIFLRNKIRHELLPLLEKKYNPRIKSSLANMNYSIADDYAFLLEQAGRAFQRLARTPQKNTFTFSLAQLKKLHPSILRLVLRLAIEHIRGDTRQLTLTHIRSAESLLNSAAPNTTIINLPGKIVVQKKNAFLTVRGE